MLRKKKSKIARDEKKGLKSQEIAPLRNLILICYLLFIGDWEELFKIFKLFRVKNGLVKKGLNAMARCTYITDADSDKRY